MSKVLRGTETQAAQPLQWRRVAGEPVRQSPIGALIVSEPASQIPTTAGDTPQIPAMQHILTTDNELSAVKAKLLEVESNFERRVREARDAGFRDGENAMRAQVVPVLEKLAISIQEIAHMKSRMRAEAESDLLKLSIAIARKILHREVNADPEALAGLVRIALDKIRVQELVRVRVHPQHQATVQQMMGRLAQGARIEVAADPRLPVGGIAVETTRGEFDASIDVQLREIEHGLADRLAARS